MAVNLSEEGRQQRRLGRWMILVGWLLLLGLLTMLFQSLLDKQYNPNTTPVVLSSDEGSREIVLKRNRSGHYVATGEINGHEVVFLLDTGATSVAVPERLADKIGLQRGMPGVSRTANGNVKVWSTRIDSVSLGGIEQRNISASILPSMAGDEVLLGMSFLKHLELVQRGDQLTLRQY
ncbi:MAG: TIGR02281 family clan AA aspartic protease [Chromatiales bacterium]|nr:TIGR02281 family clan AA aspartic protease [Chromatiales bacterium]